MFAGILDEVPYHLAQVPAVFLFPLEDAVLHHDNRRLTAHRQQQFSPNEDVIFLDLRLEPCLDPGHGPFINRTGLNIPENREKQR